MVDTSPTAPEPAPPPPRGARRRRLDFFFDDYVDTDARLLEVGPGDGWLGRYLVHAGFLGYRRLAAAPPADHVGRLDAWRELGFEPGSLELLLAFDGLPLEESLVDCFTLLVPGGRLFLVSPRPGRAGLVRLLARLGFGRRELGDAAPIDLTTVTGFRVRKQRAAGLTEQWAVLQKPLDSSSEVRISR